MKGISNKEMKMISYLEMEGKRFFTRKDIKKFFKSENEMNVYIYNLKKKERIVRINKIKYCLIPIQAYKGWTEHPFIIADEIFNGKNYYIGGKAASHYWGLIDQIPTVVDLFSKKKQGSYGILGTKFKFRRIRKMKEFVKRKIKEHEFLIASRKVSKKWI